MPHTPVLPTARTPIEVVRCLDALLAHCIEHGDRLGWFAALHRHTAVALMRGVAEGRFSHGSLVEDIVVDLHERYADSLRCHVRGEPIPRCWQAAFSAAQSDSFTDLQHLLMGLDAQMNHDLARSVARCIPCARFVEFKVDYEEMGELMKEEVRGALAHLSKSSRLGPRGWRSLGHVDTTMLGFSLKRAQAFAWERAQTLAAARAARSQAQVESPAERVLVAALDALATGRQHSLRRPKPWRRSALIVLRTRQAENVARQIRAFRDATPGAYAARERGRALRDAHVMLARPPAG